MRRLIAFADYWWCIGGLGIGFGHRVRLAWRAATLKETQHE